MARSRGWRLSTHMSIANIDSATKVLFLDIDGVLNTTDTMLANKGKLRFAPAPVAAMAKILSSTDCHIVITSTRRRSGLEAIKQAFRDNGLHDAADRIIDATPILSESDTDDFRAEEICSWIRENGFLGRCAILDDAPIEGFPAITTSHELGLTARDAERAIRLFG
jgi:hypothetical protein